MFAFSWSLSRYSRSISASMRLLITCLQDSMLHKRGQMLNTQIRHNAGGLPDMQAGQAQKHTLGLGRKNASWASTSASSCWWGRVLRAFIIRTIAASMAMDLSSSTRLGLCVSSSEAIGTRILRIGQVNFSLNLNLSLVAMDCREEQFVTENEKELR